MDTVAGYRLLRKLGEATRAEVWLGHSRQSEDRVVALKIFRPATTLESIDTEIEALGRARSPHLLTLDDIASAADGRPCFILQRLSSTSLSRLLVTRSSFSAGEIVTAVAPLVGAVAELHSVGIVHGAIEASAVLLDRSGAPVLAGFGKALIVGAVPAPGSQSLTLAERAADLRMAADRLSLVALVSALAGRVAGEAEATAAMQLVDWMRSSVAKDDFLPSLADHLFELASGDELLLEDAATPAARRVVRSGRAIAAPSIELAARGHPAGARPRAADRIAALLDGHGGAGDVVSAIREAVTRARKLVAPVRRPVWIAGAAGIVALVVAFAVIPSSDSDGETASESVSSDGVTEGQRSPSPDVPVHGSPASPNPTAEKHRETAISSDDPLAAAQALLSAREECFARKSPGCLGEVEQEGSAAIEADRHLLRPGKSSASASADTWVGDFPDADRLSLVQRLGDSAIIGIGLPDAAGLYAASILVVKTDSGWRIRDLTTAASTS